MRDDRSNIVLTGFMGTGKTTVGRAIADRLRMVFVDTDAVIEERHGPIPTIFAEHGEERFRELERDVARELSERPGLVVATGGRMMVDPANAEALGETGLVVCLTATVDTIYKRVRDGIESRPMLGGDDAKGRIAQLLAERQPSYERFVQVITDGRSIDDIVDEIVAIGRRAD
jgi:shikimate kinase